MTIARRAFVFVPLLVLATAAPAAADDAGVQIGVRGGALTLIERKVGDTSALLTVRDARGTGAGWTLTVRGDVNVVSVRVRCSRGSTCTLPRGKVAYPIEARPSTVTDMLDARPDTGMGSITLRVTFTADPHAAAPQFGLHGR